MRLEFRLAGGAALALALFAGDIGALSLAPAAASAEGHGGFRGGGGFHGGGGFGDHDGFRGGWGGCGGSYRGYG